MRTLQAAGNIGGSNLALVAGKPGAVSSTTVTFADRLSGGRQPALLLRERGLRRSTVAVMLS